MRIETVHLVVLEARLETMDCLDVIGALKERPQPVRVIVLTSIADSFVREEVARAGGDAYLVKPCPVEVLFLALKGACLGTRMGWQDNWPRPENLVSHPNSGLSLIQQLILRRLVQDRTVQQIAGDLGLRFSSVHTHLARLRKRFEVHNSVALIEKSRREFPGTFRHL